jgi:hypothetical protein
VPEQRIQAAHEVFIILQPIPLCDFIIIANILLSKNAWICFKDIFCTGFGPELAGDQNDSQNDKCLVFQNALESWI